MRLRAYTPRGYRLRSLALGTIGPCLRDGGEGTPTSADTATRDRAPFDRNIPWEDCDIDSELEIKLHFRKKRDQ